METKTLKTRMQMVYWKESEFWLGKLIEHPEIMTQGKTLEELEENIKDAYLMMLMDDVPEQHEVKQIDI
ncbi:MAG: type II toxin-antitoxin system HicB family antitoxin [Candidatus Latescibacteria bacterium]|jgi:predicted RNase H-like HicB family nuclease|nr:type II toxin-antitoxin system HicB family antitoxin [Candidatus Latescibacterota bacterium]